MYRPTHRHWDGLWNTHNRIEKIKTNRPGKQDTDRDDQTAERQTDQTRETDRPDQRDRRPHAWGRTRCEVIVSKFSSKTPSFFWSPQLLPSAQLVIIELCATCFALSSTGFSLSSTGFAISSTSCAIISACNQSCVEQVLPSAQPIITELCWTGFALSSAYNHWAVLNRFCPQLSL